VVQLTRKEMAFDASDILNIPRERTGPAVAPKIKPPTTKKPDGVSREVFALTAGMPCVVPTAASAYKERRHLGKATPWRWKEFSNSARSDEVKFYHWAKKNDNDEYYFTTFNKTMTVDKYTDEEYTAHFEDDSWTKPETDKLFELCQRLDTRFITVADRLENRSVEDVKARYYSIARKLLDVRGQYNDDELSTMPLYRFQYDKEYDVRRKAQLNQLHKRTPADEVEEAKLIAELKAVDETLKRDQKLRVQARKKATAASHMDDPPSPRDTITSGRPVREAKRQRTTRPSNKNKGAPIGMRVVEPDEPPEAKVQRKLQQLGVDSWPLPVANVTIAHSALVDDLMKLVELEAKLRARNHAS